MLYHRNYIVATTNEQSFLRDYGNQIYSRVDFVVSPLQLSRRQSSASNLVRSSHPSQEHAAQATGTSVVCQGHMVRFYGTSG